MINITISTNFLVIISFIILLIIIGVIAYIIYNDKKIDQAEIDDLIDDIVKAKPRDQKEKSDEVKVKQIESATPSKLNLEEMLNTMQSDLNKKQDKIEKYEQEQDENAIISIKELEKFKSNNVEQYEKDQENNAIINMSEVEKVNSIDRLTEKEELLKSPVKEAISKVEKKEKKYKTSDFISPIFGTMKETIEYPKVNEYNKEADLNINEYFGKDVLSSQLEQSIDIEPVSDEIKKNMEFLNALKEFRNNL